MKSSDIAPHFGKNVLLYGSHEWLPYSKDEVRLKTVNNNLPVREAVVSPILSLRLPSVKAAYSPFPAHKLAIQTQQRRGSL